MPGRAIVSWIKGAESYLHHFANALTKLQELLSPK